MANVSKKFEKAFEIPSLPIFVSKIINSGWEQNFQPKNSHRVPHPETNSLDTYLLAEVRLSQR